MSAVSSVARARCSALFTEATLGSSSSAPSAALEAVEAPPGADERLLDGVLGLEWGAEHPVAVGRQLGAMLLAPLLDVTGCLSRRAIGRTDCRLELGDPRPVPHDAPW